MYRMLIGRSKGVDAAALLWPAALVVWGPGSASSLHRHHCVQLVLALRETLRFRRRSGQRWMKCDAVLVRPDVPHEVDASNTEVLIAFVDPESELGTALLDRVTGEISALTPEQVAGWRSALGDPATLNAARVEPWLTAELLHGRKPPRLDPRVKRVLRLLRDQLRDSDDISLEPLAVAVGLSPSRLMHLFTDSVGVPLRPYVLWLRIQRAAGALASGRSITESAHEAGFADAAHLTRTFRRMLGATPRDIIRRQPATRDLHLA
jgi:AraC-like DNA-binding protein